MFVWVGLFVVALAITLLLVFKFKPKSVVSYDQARYEGTKTNFSTLSSFDLSEFVKNRDAGWSWETLGGNVEALASSLKTDIGSGLSGSDFVSRKKHFGINRFKEVPARPFLEFFLGTFEDRTLQILLISAIVSIILGVTVEDPSTGWIEGTAIFVAALVVSFVTAGNDYSKDKQFKKLSAINQDKKVEVVRGGKVSVVSTFDLLVGDIVILHTGDAIPADGIFVSGDSISVDESSLTGEPVPVKKSEKNPFFLSGCAVVEGVGKMVVICTGMNSEYGKLKSMIDQEHENTPLQDTLEEMADFIGWCGVTAAVLTFLALLGKWALHRFVFTDLGWNWGEADEIVEFIIVSITIVAVAVPEGLPLSVTISLAYSMQQMMNDQNLVRHLAACETMGGATTICSDKTGTLTENKMKVTCGWVCGQNFDLESFKNIQEEITSEKAYHFFVDNLAVNTTANVLIQGGKKVTTGPPTECALLELLTNMKVDYVTVRAQSEPKKLRTFPFSSSKKRMSTALSSADGDSAVLFVKGASEVVLSSCNHWLQKNGETADISKDLRQQLSAQIDEWAGRGLRTLSLGYKLLRKGDVLNADDGSVDDDLTLVAICGIEDPIRPEVPGAVKACQRAGITVRMLTGDNLLTAKDIARQCGILTSTGVALEGPVFRKMDDEDLTAIIKDLQVIARCSPEDKLKLVKFLKAQGEVVAVTRDGTNDAPQLTAADVGFAMGISGTEVAKEASDIILLDDNFNSIMKAVLWGRNVYDSIRKFVQFQLTVNIAAVAIAFIGALSKGQTPLKAVQLLWLNLIMDTMAALALATDKPEMSILDRPPIGRNTPLITKKMAIFIVGQAIFQLFVLLTLLYIPASSLSFLGLVEDSSDKLRNTILFNTFVFCQLFNELNCRRLDDWQIFNRFFQNKLFIAILVISVFVQFLMVQYFGSFAETVPLDSTQWLFCVFVSSFTLPWGKVLRSLSGPNEKPILPSPPALSSAEIRNAKKGWAAARKIQTQVRVINALRQNPSPRRPDSKKDK